MNNSAAYGCMGVLVVVLIVLFAVSFRANRSTRAYCQFEMSSFVGKLGQEDAPQYTTHCKSYPKSTIPNWGRCPYGKCDKGFFSEDCGSGGCACHECNGPCPVQTPVSSPHAWW